MSVEATRYFAEAHGTEVDRRVDSEPWAPWCAEDGDIGESDDHGKLRQMPRLSNGQDAAGGPWCQA
jgi:hypothetical protein